MSTPLRRRLLSVGLLVGRVKAGQQKASAAPERRFTAQEDRRQQHESAAADICMLALVQHF